ncbi:MAG TPA: alkaline phosphatase family protein [Saprospiraceae bacterium]|nr:alkaline phosphatase family protein [Saprospiraceae bacterium]
MNRKALFLSIQMVILTLAILTNLHAQKVTGIKHVILIGVDGLSPDGIRKAHTPVMDKLMATGAYTLHARCVTPSSSSSNWASMIMGADVEQHGIHSNDYERDRFILPPVVNGSSDIFPTIFGEIDKQIKEAKIAAVYHWKGFGRLFEANAVDYNQAAESEDQAMDLALKYLLREKPVFTFVHLDHVDHAGHVYGHGSPAYYASVEKADSLIGRMVVAIEALGIQDQTLLLISADHGGIGMGHGGLTLAEMEIPLILWGKSVKKGYTIPTPVYQYDNAATIAFALGIQAPYAWIGRPVQCAFQGFEAPANNYPVNEWMEKPVITPGNSSGMYGQGGLFFKDTTISISANNTAYKTYSIRYTIDGSMPDAQSETYTSPIKFRSNMVLRAALFDGIKRVSEISEANFRLADKEKNAPITYQCYLAENLKQLPDFHELTPVKEGKSYEFSSAELTLPRQENVAVVFSGNINIETEGNYQLFTRSDDGSKLYLDNKLVVNNDGDHGIQEKSGKISLKKGMHSIRVEWFNGGGGSWLDVSIEGGGIPRQIIPLRMLR